VQLAVLIIAPALRAISDLLYLKQKLRLIDKIANLIVALTRKSSRSRKTSILEAIGAAAIF
jgi:hypothetical protein